MPRLTGGRSRTSLLSDDHCRRTLAIAREVAGRLVDRERLRGATIMAAGQAAEPRSIAWLPYGVSGGDAGVAILCAALDACFPDEGWDSIGHEFLAVGARAVGRVEHLPIGLFNGLSGLCFAAASLSRGGTRYRRMLDSLDAELAARVPTLGRSLRSQDHGARPSDLDVVSGMSGVVAYLLLRDSHGCLPAALGHLVWLAGDADGRPRWATPSHLLEGEPMRAAFPDGNLNCGLAHGVPGPLAAMALALRAGHEVAGQAAAVRGLASWLVHHRTDDEWGPNWPSAFPLPSVGAGAGPSAAVPTRSAWCYGSPGVARALWIAGDALGDDDLRRFAVEAVCAVLRRPVAVRHVDSPTFCHGLAGLAHIVGRFAADIRAPVLLDGAGELVEQLLCAYDPDRLLGFAAREHDGRQVDRPGLLDGAPGVVLTLLAAATDVEPAWDRLFLLS